MDSSSGAMRPSGATHSSGAPQGAQTLARGIQVLKDVVVSRDGLSIQEVASRAGIHRSVASRLLSTLAEAEFVVRGSDGRYRGGFGLIPLARSGIIAFRQAMLPEVKRLAAQLGSTMTLFIEQAGTTFTLIVETPRDKDFHLAVREGVSLPFDRGAAAWVLRSLHPAQADDPPFLTQTRAQGWARTFGEIEPGVWALAVPIPSDGQCPNSCFTLITPREDALDGALAPMLEAAARVAAARLSRD